MPNQTFNHSQSPLKIPPGFYTGVFQRAAKLRRNGTGPPCQLDVARGVGKALT